MQGVLLLRRRRDLCALLPHENTRPGVIVKLGAFTYVIYLRQIYN